MEGSTLHALRDSLSSASYYKHHGITSTTNSSTVHSLPPPIITSTTAIKVLIDQFVQAPIFTVIIFAFLGLLEGKSIADIKRQLDDDYVDTMLANWKLWVPATAVNIAFCPPILRVLFLNVVFFFWSIFLSLKLNKSED